MDQIKHLDMFRGSSTQFYVPAFTQKDFHYIVHTGLPTQGTSTENLVNKTLEYTTLEYTQLWSTQLLSQLTQPLHKRQGTKPHKINLTIEG